MTNPVPGAPFLQRSCALCGTVDDGPRERIVTPSGQDAFYHHTDDPKCAVPNADPRPDLDEPPSVSRQRHALTHDPNCVTPPDSEYLTTHVIDCSDPQAEIVTLSERPADTTEA